MEFTVIIPYKIFVTASSIYSITNKNYKAPVSLSFRKAVKALFELTYSVHISH